MMQKIGTFLGHNAVQYGTIVVTHKGQMVWAGPSRECPLDDFEEGSAIYLHPTQMVELGLAVAKVEEGIPDEDQPTDH